MRKENIILTVIFTLILVCIISLSTYAQEGSKAEDKNLAELSLEDLLNMEVTTASKKAEKITDAPGVISIITSDEIKSFGANSLQDILERATSIQTNGSHLFPSNISATRGDLRTLYDNHMLLLIDGRPILDGILGGVNAPVYSAFPISLIERIEIIRGPGSVLYGSNAFVGVINIITRANNESTSLDIKASGGSFGTFNGLLTGIYANEDFSAKISTKINTINGWDYSAVTVRPGAPNLPIDKKWGQKNIGVATDLKYKDLTLFGFYTNDVHDMLGIIPYAPQAGKNKYERLFLNLGYTYGFSDTWSATANLTHSGSELRLDDEAAGIPVDHHSSADYIGEITLNGEIVNNFNIVVGGSIDSRNKNKVGATDAIKNPYHHTKVAAYLQTDYRPIDQLKLILGAQLNKPESKDWDLVPRFGAIFNFTSEFGVKALYGQAFRSPWPVEQLLENPAVQGNPNLDPEKIGTLDVQVFYAAKKAEASVTYYNSKYTNSITRVPVAGKPGVVTYANQGELNMYGFELEGKVSVLSDLFITGSATYQKNADENTVAVYIPDFMGKIGAIYNINSNLTVGLFNSLFGKPRENKGQVLNPAAELVDLLSINLTYKLPADLPLEFNVYVQNLLDSDYNYTEFSRGWVNTLPVWPGRAIYAGVGFKL